MGLRRREGKVIMDRCSNGVINGEALITVQGQTSVVMLREETCGIPLNKKQKPKCKKTQFHRGQKR